MDTPNDPLEDRFERERLHRAAQDGDLVEVRRLIDAGRAVNAFDDLSFTPLHYAAREGHLDVATVLLDAGADVDAHDEARIGNTPLREIAGECSLELARLLLEAGADPTIPGWMQLTALDKSADRKTPEGIRVHELLRGAAEKRPRRRPRR